MVCHLNNGQKTATDSCFTDFLIVDEPSQLLCRFSPLSGVSTLQTGERQICRVQFFVYL